MPDRVQLLKKIQEIGFTIDDLTLYLDTHPLDEAALNAFTKAKETRYEFMKEYAQRYEPLNLYLVCPDTNNESQTFCKYPGKRHFTWSDGPLPWDNQGGA